MAAAVVIIEGSMVMVVATELTITAQPGQEQLLRHQGDDHIGLQWRHVVTQGDRGRQRI